MEDVGPSGSLGSSISPQERDLLAQTFPRRSLPRKQLSFNKLVENRAFYKAVGAMRRRHRANVTIAGTKPLATFARWREHAKTKRPKTPPGVKFRRYIRLTLICIRLCKTSYESLEAARGEFLSVSQYSEEFKTIIDKDGLVFDPSEFKANKEGRASAETKRILQTKFDERTEKDIDHLMVALKSIKSFKEYPRNIQEKLCQVGWYETFGPKRAIIRQGHPPRAFYFILSGTVVVTKFDRRTHDFQILVFLQQGMSFGELAVIKRGVRQATVSSKTGVELLCISVADYRNIFMAGTFKNLTDSEMNTFIRNIGFLKKFPINILSDEKYQNDFLFHYYHRGQILARDSNCSDWIFIVKSGSVSVLKKLRSHDLNVLLFLSHVVSEYRFVLQPSIETCEAANRPNIESPCCLRNLKVTDFHGRKPEASFVDRASEEKETFKDYTEMEKRLVESLPGYRTEAERMGILDYEAIIQDYRARVVESVTSSVPEPERVILPDISTISATKAEDGETEGGPAVRKNSKGAYLSMSPSKRKLSRAEVKKNAMEELRKKTEDEKRVLERSLANRKTMADELDSKAGQKYTEQTAADLHPMFIEVQVLERGQYFGVSNLVYGEQPSLSLVSNGAECIMISKRLFLQHALAATMDLLRQQECPFPATGGNADEPPGIL
ncbi:uncharacterized protein LOC135461517 [Liolophura sinensis]|uniref:uncharacterized protein LOC135461517 n=1 Tax=Liolophura sinensis TaxID=3198878 RepID=UPI003158B503